MRFRNAASAALSTILLLAIPTIAQTWSSCNPLTQSGCPADPALGKAISVDFTKGAVDSFTADGNPTYDSNGVSFTVAASGQAPQLISKFYIMFGKVSITMKCAPGAGIVSSLVLESDDLDEIDFEWLGADDTQVQTNYFGKGNTATYNRGAFSSNPNNQDGFITYSIEYTSSQVVWSIDGQTIRVLSASSAEANSYPQTPMQVKFGAWSGGDPSNAPGTISWARGPTDYSKGPFTMVVQSIAISDYSTGTSYSYTGTSGAWTDITSSGGAINANSGGSAPIQANPSSDSSTSASPSIPVGGIGDQSTRVTTGWPWVATTMVTSAGSAAAAQTSVAGIPPGWTVSSDGKIVPIKSTSGAQAPIPNTPIIITSSYSPPPSSPSSAAGTPESQQGAPEGEETITTFDGRGFLTTMAVPIGWETMLKSYDQQGLLIPPSSGMGIVITAAADASPTGVKAEAATKLTTASSALVSGDGAGSGSGSGSGKKSAGSSVSVSLRQACLSNMLLSGAAAAMLSFGD